MQFSEEIDKSFDSLNKIPFYVVTDATDMSDMEANVIYNMDNPSEGVFQSFDMCQGGLDTLLIGSSNPLSFLYFE